MNFIIDSISKIIIGNTPDLNSEMMIKIDSFQDLNIYHSIAKKVSSHYSKSKYKFDIKLAKNKWDFFRTNCTDTSVLNSMITNKWIAETESITYYRNLHINHILILLGTEDEEDKGGLMNCFSITPDYLVSNVVKKAYHKVFEENLPHFSENEYKIIDKLYSDLFEFVPIDIVKLSNFSDQLNGVVDNIDTFVKLFFKNLPLWGLPFKAEEESLPDYKALASKSNLLREMYSFISRNMFSKISVSAYKKIQDKLNNYKTDEKSLYGPMWSGWSYQGIKSFDELENILEEFMLGKEIAKNKEKLIKTDFAIIENILNLKITGPGPKEKKPKINVNGDPLHVFTKTLLLQLNSIREKNIDIDKIKFNFESAEIVSMISSDETEEEISQLKLSWDNLCRHTNGIIEYLNNRNWEVNETVIELYTYPNQFFSPKNSLKNINDGIVKSASSNKTMSKISFTIECFYKNNKIKDSELDVIWNIPSSSSWLYTFSELINCNLELKESEPYIPLTSCNKMNSLIFSKSEEEFFDIFNESTLDFKYNVINFVSHSYNVSKEFLGYFYELGQSFSSILVDIRENGLYSTLLSMPSKIADLTYKYSKLGNKIIGKTWPSTEVYMLNAFIHAFNIENDTNSLVKESDINSCIVPPWHPASLEKINNQKIFILDGCQEWWNVINSDPDKKASKAAIEEITNNFIQMSMIQSSVDLFPTSKSQYFGQLNSFGNYSIYASGDLENNTRLKDIIHKDAIFDDDFSQKEICQMNDNAKLILGVLNDYKKAFPNSCNNLNLVFVNPSELQPIVSAIYRYINVCKEKDKNCKLNVRLKILVKPENKGGKNYLAYWMDEFFSQDENINIKTYLNEWNSTSALNNLLDGNNDIIFMMDLLNVNNLSFIKNEQKLKSLVSDCLFPIVYKPTPVSKTSVKRSIELSQPQFKSSFIHTQVVRYRGNLESMPVANYMASREVSIDDNVKELIYKLHEKAYWVVCVDSGIDGALLRGNDTSKKEYSIIGYSTGKGAYGQYNLTITARNSILQIIEDKLYNRLNQVFHWEKDKLKKATQMCLTEAGGLDGISLLSAINQNDYNINEFLAYVLTSIKERDENSQSSLKIIVHLDSYKHWFSGEIDKDESDSKSRPDFLLLEAYNSEEKLRLKATIVECKIASISNSSGHKEKAYSQVVHGIERLSQIFDPNSKSVKRRYWFAQLYRALTFAQISFTDNSSEYTDLAIKLRNILEGEFEIEWTGKVYGYWFDMLGENIVENSTDRDDIVIYDIPQLQIQKYLLNDSNVEYIHVDSEDILNENSDEETSQTEKELEEELANLDTDILIGPKVDDEEISEEDSQEVKDENPENEVSLEVENENHEDEDSQEVKDENPEDEVSPEVDDENHEDEDSQEVKDEKIPLEETRVLIGSSKTGEQIHWEFGNPKLANRHMLITGTSGQGKTYSIQTMLYELSKSNVSSIVFDYTEGFRMDQLEKPFVERMAGKINERIIYYEGVPINPFKKNDLEIAGKVFKEKDSDVAARLANIFMHVYNFGEQQFSAIYEAIRLGLTKYKDNMNMLYFQKELENIKSANPAAKTVLSKLTPFFHSVEFNGNDDFDWGDILYSDNSQLNIFQLTNIDSEMQVIITEMMLWDAWYYTQKHGNKDKPFVVILDEAQNLSHGDKSPSKKILTEGRKFGWSAWFATQSLKVLKDDEIIRLLQAAIKLYFKPTDEEVVKISKQLDPTNSSIWLSSIQNLKKGQCIVVGERLKSDGTFGSSKPTVTSVTAFNNRK